ncbi:MFS transporter [Demequina capsici]|uniref:MFS transporter n=1 Tax=Demequina capsici TaxID=3075620 RepID=A0AA96F8V7_9MICO|nr:MULTISPECIES: MFS transporter [unclassified Demequina]WNM24805.1 MFS transporter [Demequina sp. OYTSA14]WNM27712.1 MFS transporter [Demequina sp. PMTSA13]
MTDARTPAQKRTAWVVFGIASAVYFVAVIHRTALGVASVEAADRFAVEATALSMLAVLQIAAYAGMQVPAGVLIDRWGPARIMVAGSLVMAVGQLLMALAPSYGWALVARLLIGAGDAPIFIAATKLVGQHFPPQRVPVMLQVTGLIGQAGQLATAIPVAFVLHASGWSPTFLVLAGVGVGAAVLAWWTLVRPTLGTDEERPTGTSVAEALRTHWTTPGVRLGFWSHYIGPFSANTLALLWGVPFFTTGQGRTPAEASLLLTCMVLTNIAVGPVIGALTAKHPMRRSWLVLGGASLTALAWIVVLVPSTPRPLWELVIFVMVIAAGGPMSLVGMDFARSFAVQGKAGSATGFVNMGGFVASIIAILLVGAVLELVSPAGTTSYTLGEYRWAFTALLIPWLIGVVGVVRSRRETRLVMAADGVHVPTVREVWERFRER